MEGIVVGADETAAGIAAARWALEEGALRGVPVTVLRAWADPVALGYGVGMALAAELETSRRAAEDSARDVLCRAGGPADGTAASSVAVRGRAAEVLTQVSATADLVVVGTRSAGALSRGILGSVSASVLHHAHCPVVVVPEPHDDEATSSRRVVVGVDHSPSSVHALGWAAEEAERRSWPLVPVVVREPVSLGSGRSGEAVDIARLEASERAALTAAARQHHPDVTVEPEVLTGHAAQALLAFARPRDLVVLGSRGRGGFRSLLLGSTSTAVAEHARCPVVVIRPPQPTDAH